MEEEFQNAEKILKKYQQEHLLNFFDELNILQKNLLISQINSIDFEFIKKLYLSLENQKSISNQRISPITYTVKKNIPTIQKKMYTSIGEKILSNNEFAVVTLAGGQGTRLGYKGPKGCYEIDVPPKRSLFEFTCDKLKHANLQYGCSIPWYIMTSPSNDEQTKLYFKNHNFFNYPKDNVFFFMQNVLPLIDTSGKIILDNIYTIKTASNGNGDLFKSISNYIDVMKSQKIKWIFTAGIDNIILDIVDPLFIGLTAYNNSDVASKSIRKKDINSKDWVFANIDNRVGMVNPIHLPQDLLNTVSTNDFCGYNQINILAHLFNISIFSKLTNVKLPYHMALKKNDFINDEGMKIVPTSPNTYKFEKFIFDSFKYSPNFTLLEVEDFQEFAPIKSFTGNFTPETALELYLNKLSICNI